MSVFPRRNLSPEAEPWGREVELRTVSLESAVRSLTSDVAGQNRTGAATSGDLARKLQRLQVLLDSIPVTRQNSAEASGFGLSGGWQTIASATVQAPEDKNNAEVLAVATGRLESTSSSLVTGSARLAYPGGTTPEFPFAWFPGSGNFVAIFNPTFSWAQGVPPGSAISVSLQVNPDDAATWGPTARNYASVTVFATFSND